jgi:putative PIN family toxin of toxin-antitoxin system
MTVVLDTNVIFSAIASPHGASFAIVSSLPSKKFSTAISLPLFKEYEDVTHRVGTRMDHVPVSKRENLIRFVASISIQKVIYYLWRHQLPDPKDAMVLEVAIASQASYIITYNTKDFQPALSFGITPIKPGDFIQTIGGLP